MATRKKRIAQLIERRLQNGEPIQKVISDLVADGYNLELLQKVLKTEMDLGFDAPEFSKIKEETEIRQAPNNKFIDIDPCEGTIDIPSLLTMTYQTEKPQTQTDNPKSEKPESEILPKKEKVLELSLPRLKRSKVDLMPHPSDLKYNHPAPLKSEKMISERSYVRRTREGLGIRIFSLLALMVILGATVYYAIFGIFGTKSNNQYIIPIAEIERNPLPPIMIPDPVEPKAVEIKAVERKSVAIQIPDKPKKITTRKSLKKIKKRKVAEKSKKHFPKKRIVKFNSKPKKSKAKLKKKKANRKLASKNSRKNRVKKDSSDWQFVLKNQTINILDDNSLGPNKTVNQSTEKKLYGLESN